MPKKYLSLEELAAYIGVAVKTLYNWKSSSPEKLPPHVCIPTGGKREIWRFDVVDVDRWMHGDQEEQAVGL